MIEGLANAVSGMYTCLAIVVVFLGVIVIALSITIAEGGGFVYALKMIGIGLVVAFTIVGVVAVLRAIAE